MPKITFQISFEEFLEYYGRSEFTKNPKITQKLAFLSATLIIMGSVFALGDKDASIVPTGALAVSAGFILGILLVPFWFAVDRGHGAEQRLTLRKSYEGFYKEARTLEFNESTWSYSYGSSTNSGDWKNIVSFRQSKSLFVFGDQYVEYIFPVASVSPEIANELVTRFQTALGWNSGLFRMILHSTFFSYGRAWFLYRWSRQRSKMLALYVLGTIFSCLIAVVFGDALSVSSWPITTVLLLLIPLSDLLNASMKFVKYRQGFIFQTAAISPNSFCLKDDYRFWKFSLEWLIDWHETPWEFCLVSPDQFYQFSKKDLTSEQSDSFRHILQGVKPLYP